MARLDQLSSEGRARLLEGQKAALRIGAGGRIFVPETASVPIFMGTLTRNAPAPRNSPYVHGRLHARHGRARGHRMPAGRDDAARRVPPDVPSAADAALGGAAAAPVGDDPGA